MDLLNGLFFKSYWFDEFMLFSSILFLIAFLGFRDTFDITFLLGTMSTALFTF